MSNHNETPNTLQPEQLVAEDIREAIWLRLRRLTSPTLCSRIVSARAADGAERKGNELASSIRSALGYWESRPAALNAKVLTRYYALLQISIAEQVAHPTSDAGLDEIQRHTEAGHGLWTIAEPSREFPFGYMVACRNRGHFYEYCQFRGIDASPFASKARPESWEKLDDKGKARLVSLADLFRRIPELQSIVEESLGGPPLSFHVGPGADNMERHVEQMMLAGEDPSLVAPEIETTIGIYPHSQSVTLEFLQSLDLPIKSIRPAFDEIAGQSYFVGNLTHPTKKSWDESLGTYKSGYCGTSVIVPLWQSITDTFLLHFMLLYALSIVVRYLPSLWHQIENGKLDHLRALIEHYLAIVDNVLPQIALERITGRRIIAVQPGSIFGPI